MLKQQRLLKISDEDQKLYLSLIAEIINWSKDRGLHTNSSPALQVPKLYEELGEMARAYQKIEEQKLEFMDGLGDTVVVMGVTISQLFKYNTDLALDQLADYMQAQSGALEYDDKTQIFVHAIGCVNNFCERATLKLETVNSLARTLNWLEVLADYKGVKLTECVKMALTTISYRSGKLENGIFIKVKPNCSIVLPINLLALSLDEIKAKVSEYATANNLEFFKIEWSEQEEITTVEV